MMPPGDFLIANVPLPGDGLEHEPAWFDQLRELRAEAQDFQAFLNNVRKGQVTLALFAEYVDRTKQDISELTSQIIDGDSIRHIHNLWEQMLSNPVLSNPKSKFDAQAQLHYLDLLDEQIQKLVFLIGFLTIPERVNHWLKLARPGYYIPFHTVFEDELPSFEERQRILNYMAWSPETVCGGLVDAANGLIYRYSEKPLNRWLSLLWVMLGLAASVGIVIGIASLRIENWPITTANLPTLLVSWLAVLGGVIVHIAIGNIKRSQAQGGLPPILAVGNILLMTDARVGHILLKLFLALVGFLGLVFASGITNVSALNSFLVGYTLDSFVELFGASLEQQANTQLTLLKQQLGVTKG
jgi:hypothetical protein